MIIRKLCLATLLAISSLSVSAADLTYGQARSLMHERADKLKMNQAVIEQKEYEVKAARSLSGPKVTLNAQQVEGRKDIELKADLSGIAGQLNPMLGSMQLPIRIPNTFRYAEELDISGPRASIDVMWPLYTGGAVSAKQEATRAAVRQAQADLSATREELDTLLVQKYFGVQLARSVEKLRADLLQQQERDLKRARRFEKAGMIAKIERMSAQVNRDTAERELLGAKTDRKVAESELNKLLKNDATDTLATPLFVTRDLKSLEFWQNEALASSPVIRAIEAQHEQARMGVKAAKGSFHPQIYAFGHYNMIKHYLTLPEPDWIAGIGVTFTLWDNRDRSARVGGAQALVNKAQAGLDEARNEIKKLVEVAYLRSSDALKQYDLTVSAIDLAKENVRLREKSFREGLSTVDDVNDARNKLIAAQVARQVAGYRFVVAFSYLHAAAGRMQDYQHTFNRPDVIVID